MKKKVLVIEDNDQNRYLVRFLLQECGYDVLEAKSGPEGIRLTHEKRPDLILLDIQLPGMDGYEIATALRSSPDAEGAPIVAVTSYAMPGDRDKVLNAGCNGYIEKPIDPATFVAEIEQFLCPSSPSEGEA